MPPARETGTTLVVLELLAVGDPLAELTKTHTVKEILPEGLRVEK